MGISAEAVQRLRDAGVTLVVGCTRYEAALALVDALDTERGSPLAPVRLARSEPARSISTIFDVFV